MICGNCQQWTSKVVIKESGKEQCENCADGGLHLDPAWMRHKPTPRWESHPHEYRKTYEPDGSVLMMPTDESKADLEAQILKPAEDDVIAHEKALEAKRGRKTVLEGAELDAAMKRANRIAEGCVAEWKLQVQENEQAWQEAANELKVQ